MGEVARREWRMVDAAGAPVDTGEGMWPIFENEQDARDQLELYQEDDLADEVLHLEVREVGAWSACQAPGGGMTTDELWNACNSHERRA